MKEIIGRNVAPCSRYEALIYLLSTRALSRAWKGQTTGHFKP